MSWLSFIAGMFVGVIFGAVIMSLCAMAQLSGGVSEEEWRRIERRERE